nr:hypothetical protein [uncultured Roseateles sp.]
MPFEYLVYTWQLHKRSCPVWFVLHRSAAQPRQPPCHLGTGPFAKSRALHRLFFLAQANPSFALATTRSPSASAFAVVAESGPATGKIRKIKYLRRLRGEQHYKGESQSAFRRKNPHKAWQSSGSFPSKSGQAQ